MPPTHYDVFLSRKSQDAHLAKELYDFLTSKGLKVFDSDHSLQEMGNADYSRAIDEALVNTEHLIVVGSSVENISSPWVEAEWRFFLNRKRSGKAKGNLLTVVTNGIKMDELPPSLQNYEVLENKKDRFNHVWAYVKSNLIQDEKESLPTHGGRENNITEKLFSKDEVIYRNLNQDQLEEWRQKGINFLSRNEYVDALNWFRKAAEKGYGKAQYNLAVMYDNGLGVGKNFKEALKWFEKAAQQGNADAQFTLAWMYDEGYGVGIDATEAISLYRKAAEKGNTHAQYELGARYEFGNNVRKNITVAVSWYRKAAEQGNAAAKQRLIRLNQSW